MAANVMEIYGSKVFNEHVMKERLPRPLSGPCILLAAAPTAPPCFRHRRRSSPLHVLRSLSGFRPLHLLTQTALPLESPTGAFIVAQPRDAPNTFSREGPLRRNAFFRFDLSCEKEVQKNPQIFLEPQNKKERFL